ncbi:MAG: efflux RND transporter periplasmic adaptor subunit [Gammaproteobacteria bacterium]|nr:efflux RND transporter periplasmic adaptor subunit [Gammaproteobacteria bacterium]MBQ0840164.1 efflux RND transporter periplasmic adaptor subunit [Gammaproteobacteria bacterium]
MRRSWSLLIVILLLSAISYVVVNYLDNRQFVTTDNAYTTGDIITVSAQLDDIVMWLGAEEGDYVEAGQALIKLDGGTQKNALDRAQNVLARTVQEVATLKQKVKRRQAELKQWEASYKLAKNEAQRRQKLAKKKMISIEERDMSVLRMAVAAASLETARQALAEARIDAGTMPIAEHPDVKRAAAWVRGQNSGVNKGTVVAPVSGHIAKRFVSPGDIIKTGKPLFQIVQLDKVWVEANFKETKLRNLRLGQPVVITSDLYGEETLYEGRVIGGGTGTGAAFSLLPAQNATGNWLKIVQRVPVRIELVGDTVATKPLPIGTSLHVSIDTSKQNGLQLNQTPKAKPVDVSSVYGYWRTGARQMTDRIIAENLPPESEPAGDKP